MGSSPPRAREPGDLLDGRYRLVARLGQGGFGDVWSADELLPDGAPFRQVALKLLLPGGGDAVDWAEEAKLLASFRHPSLVTIYAAGILEGAQRFVAMELLEGQNLAELHKERGPIPWRRVLGWAASAAGALDLIHAAGVVHLDLKPANLFLVEGGALKVLDFGIARRAGVEAVVARRGGKLPRDATVRDVERATGLFFADRTDAVGSVRRLVADEPSHDEEAFAATRPVSSSGRQVIIGTPGFMAPEVLELSEPTAAADAYALAVCVVQLCTGHLPHMAPDEPITWDDPTAVSAWLDAIRRATRSGELRAFDEGPTPLPRGLAALVRRLLAVDPQRRGVLPGKLGALFEEAWDRPHGVPDPPYFGRRPYPAEAEGLLFGRDDDVARLGRELSYEPCVVLHGAAGSGKSSLLVAGLVPFLGRHGVDGKDDWIAVPIAGPRPDEALAEALARLDPALAGEDADAEALTAYCRRSPVGVALVLDPLDDAVQSPAAARARLEALVAALAGAAVTPGVRLLGALGEDGTAALLASPLGASLRAALRYVGGPATAAVTDLVAGPAHFAGVTVLGADIVAADVRRELRAGPGRLPFVSLALEEWWRGRLATRAQDPATAETPLLHGERWRETGGVGGAVVRHAERVVAALAPDTRPIAEELLLRLSATDGAKLRWDEAELCAVVAGDGAGIAPARPCSRAPRARAAGPDRDGGSVEIGHEALLTSFPRLTAARLAQMDRLLLLERLREARLAWERADNHRDFLLHGALAAEVRLHRGVGGARPRAGGSRLPPREPAPGALPDRGAGGGPGLRGAVAGGRGGGQADGRRRPRGRGEGQGRGDRAGAARRAGRQGAPHRGPLPPRRAHRRRPRARLDRRPPAPRPPRHHQEPRPRRLPHPRPRRRALVPLGRSLPPRLGLGAHADRLRLPPPRARRHRGRRSRLRPRRARVRPLEAPHLAAPHPPRRPRGRAPGLRLRHRLRHPLGHRRGQGLPPPRRRPPRARRRGARALHRPDARGRGRPGARLRHRPRRGPLGPAEARPAGRRGRSPSLSRATSPTSPPTASAWPC